MVAIPIRWGLGKLAERAAAAAAAAAAANAAREAVKDKPGTRAREVDCSETPDAADCNKCLLVEGRVGQPSTPRYVTRGTRINYDYQLQIANMHAAPERFGYVRRGDNADEILNIDMEEIKSIFGRGGRYTTLEWIFATKSFDGFWRSRCTVVEAKANFGHFFDEDGDYAKPFTGAVVNSWGATFANQEITIAPTKPQGKLEWHFMSPAAHAAALVDAGLPATNVFFTPFVLGSFP
ncbi:Tox-REase-5 domain-containing protein [Stenotrophomonas sp. LGBM10]|uniref:Tox-REase-5 domain-containing protein n=1 Tax=Stenotrophomonas sp. LGBM10 TaxID=3390038 RepID=UPI00398B111C